MNPVLAQKLEAARRLVQTRHVEKGLALYAELFKDLPQTGIEFGRAAAFSGDFELAMQVWDKLRKQNPNDLDVILALAAEHGKIGLHAKAFALLSKASTVSPRSMEVRVRQAWILSRAGRIEEARIAVGNCLALEPRNPTAQYLFAHLDRRENKLEAAEQQVRALIANGVQQTNLRYSCHSELAHILDRTGRHEEAISMLDSAKLDARKNLDAHPEQKTFIRLEKEIQHARSLPKNILQIWANAFPANERSPIPRLSFLSGAARSGTTLLERVLDAHPSVVAFDEPLAFHNLHPFIGCAPSPLPVPQLNQWRNRYVKNLTAETAVGVADKVLLDKNPSHTLWLPALLRTIPELRVLISLRDPRDVMVSLYFNDQTFTNPLTFEQLAQHYCDVMDLWLVVREWEGLAWMETRYEDIVADLEKEGQRVTEFLGLQWHEHQARYYEKNAQKPVFSDNYNNVNKPVYTRSVQRWRVYEKHLAPILPMLEPYCKKFGYG